MISEASLNRVVNNIKNAKTFFFATVDENNQPRVLISLLLRLCYDL